jgi:cell division protein DivIC
MSKVKTESPKSKSSFDEIKSRLKIFKNKYITTFTIFLFYALFLDDYDIFNLISQKSKLNKIQKDQQIIETKLKDTRFTLKQLKHNSELERYAREEKLFKKDDEDIFILSFE